MIETYDEILIESLLKARDELKSIVEVKYRYDATLKKDLPEMDYLDMVHKGIKKFYNEVTDGFEVTWKKDSNSFIGGKMKLAETKYLFAENNGIYDEGDAEDLKYFRPLDYPTPETYVGFIIKPEVIYNSLYYMSVSNYEVTNLDLDYEGYTQMAVEARVFNHWQLVLLHYMDGEGIGSVETETFKTEMPKIFPDWTWESFIATFERLRLSNRSK